MTEEEFLKRKAENDDDDMNGLDENGLNKNYHQVMDKAKRKPIGKEWGPNSFSSTFTCYFCNEQFRKDYRLKLHLMLNHKTEPSDEMDKAKEVLTKAKLDGCVHRCALCGSKYNSVANFTRYVNDILTRTVDFRFLKKPLKKPFFQAHQGCSSNNSSSVPLQIWQLRSCFKNVQMRTLVSFCLLLI